MGKAEAQAEGTPLTAGIEKSRWAIMLSTESKKGSPRPGMTPSMLHSTTPPTESPSAAAARNDLLEAGRVAASAHLDQPGREADALRQHLLGDDACGYERHGQAGREVPSAARVVESSELAVGDQVGVRRAEVCLQPA